MKSWKDRILKTGFVRYIKETWINKLVAIALILIGYFSIFIDYDATAFVVLLFLAIVLFLIPFNLFKKD